ncbi:hypothetical protein, partial [Enterococcus faecalis]
LHSYIEDSTSDSEIRYFSDNLLLSFIIINTTAYSLLKNKIFIKEKRANYLLLMEVFDKILKEKINDQKTK